MRYIARCFNFLGSIALFLGFVTGSGFAANPHCSDVGGAILTNVNGFGTIDGHPTTMGVVTGDLKGAIGVEILSTPDANTVNVQHFWVTDNGETLTIDNAQAHGTFVNQQGLFAITDYKVHLSGGTGRFAGATGDMSAIGEVDFGTGHVILRYSGEICRR